MEIEGKFIFTKIPLRTSLPAIIQHKLTQKIKIRQSKMVENQTTSPRLFYLQDSRSNTGDNLMFWQIEGGYASDLSKAEQYSEERAFALNRSRETDIPWPVDYIEGCSRRVVDMQYVRREEISRDMESDTFYVQDRFRTYNGNDMTFVAFDGASFTNDLDKAKVFSRSEACIADGIPWPKAYIDARSRWAADCNKANIKKALKGVASELAKIKKPRGSRYRCHGCGIFLSEHDYYCIACPRCNTENRP